MGDGIWRINASFSFTFLNILLQGLKRTLEYLEGDTAYAYVRERGKGRILLDHADSNVPRDRVQ